jgi:hypothetical protein
MPETSYQTVEFPDSFANGSMQYVGPNIAESATFAPTEWLGNETSTTEEKLEAEYLVLLRQLIDFFGVYITMVVLLSGIFGNILSIIVFVRLRHRNAVTATYLAPIAVYDLINICVGVSSWLVHAAPAFSDGSVKVPEGINDLHCKLRNVVALASGCMSTWTLIVFCIERCIAIWVPLRVGVLVTTRRRRVVLILVCVFSVVVAMACIPPFRLAEDGIACAPDPQSFTELGFLIAAYIGIYLAVPIIVLCMLNGLLVCGLFYQKKSIGSKTGQVDKSKVNEFKIVRNLLLVSCLFILTVSPFCVFATIQTVFNTTGWGSVSKEFNIMINDMADFTFVFHYTNFSANYIIYALSLDFYRAECRSLFCGCR